MEVFTEKAKHDGCESMKYHKKPMQSDMTLLHNYMKFKTQTEKQPVKALLKLPSNGHNVIISIYELDHSLSIRFVSSSLVMIDVDDDDMVTNPNIVLDNLSSY